MTWTRRKTTDLLRLLREYKRERGYPDWKGINSDHVPGDEFDCAIRQIEWIESIYEESRAGRDRPMLEYLPWWCEMVRDRYGKKRHTAITWLMQQYYDKEGKQTFSRKWGAGVDSVARRLGLKVKARQVVEPRYDKEQYAEALKKGVDIYQLTFKVLKLWPEPES